MSPNRLDLLRAQQQWRQRRYQYLQLPTLAASEKQRTIIYQLEQAIENINALHQKMCVDDEKRKEDEERREEGRQVAREAHAAELAEWKKRNDLIHGRKEAKKQLFEADKAAWELEKAEAKADKRRPAWLKPKWKDYEPELFLPRPKKVVEDEDEESDDGNGSGHGSEMDED
ncbi:hypothetical protein B0H13DRAFT_1851388 [Mycena leptocephala]|nr:hypothetical protein B0H13DRAFT_1851388 [Mycena leptocephala]